VCAFDVAAGTLQDNYFEGRGIKHDCGKIGISSISGWHRGRTRRTPTKGRAKLMLIQGARGAKALMGSFWVGKEASAYPQPLTICGTNDVINRSLMRDPGGENHRVTFF